MGSTETLCSDNKFKCDTCSSYQEAHKRMRIKKLPTILALHLKRFKYMEQYNRHIKVSHRVVFPLELRLFNTSDDAVNPDRMYDLVAVVIHCGSGPNRQGSLHLNCEVSRLLVDLRRRHRRQDRP